MKNIYIYYQNEQNFIGTVYVDFARGKEVYSFEFSEYAFEHNLTHLIKDKEITNTLGRQFKNDSSKPYSFLTDLAPDRWGKNLIKRKLSNTRIWFSDYLLNVSDISRMGALRLKTNQKESFVLKEESIPPFKFINELEYAAYHYDDFSDNDEWKILLSPGSSLGGARPKSSIYNNDGELYLAKFSHKNDEYDVSKIEYFTYLLAKEVGINISESSLIEIGHNRSVFLTKRFDRNKNERIHYLSFMTLLGTTDGKSNEFSYINVAEKINSLSKQPKEDLKELFKRVAFYILVHNYDDHLRNIGMIYFDGGYRLAPCFDVNVSFYNSHLTVSVDGSDDYSLNNLINNSKYFLLSNDEGTLIVEGMKQNIKNTYLEFANKLKIDSNIVNKLTKIFN